MTAEPLPGRAISVVALRAGVSERIVRMVVAGRSSVAPGTRSQVIAAIAAVGCTEHPSNEDTGHIGVLIADSSYDHTPMIRAIVDAARDAGRSTVVLGPDDPDRILGGAGLIRVTPHGLIPVPGGTLARSATAAVTLGHHAGAQLATRHLLDQGHRRVWHLGGPVDCPIAQQREAGWRRALTDAGIEAPPVIWSGWSAEAGYSAARELARRPECRAVFAAGDQIALGVLRAMSDAGRSVPGSVSIVGFDDLAESAFLSPPLSTVRLDLAQAGRAAVDVLLGLGTGEPVVIDPVLVVRQTVAGPAAGHSGRAHSQPRPRTASSAGH